THGSPESERAPRACEPQRRPRRVGPGRRPAAERRVLPLGPLDHHRGTSPRGWRGIPASAAGKAAPTPGSLRDISRWRVIRIEVVPHHHGTPPCSLDLLLWAASSLSPELSSLLARIIPRPILVRRAVESRRARATHHPPLRARASPAVATASKTTAKR